MYTALLVASEQFTGVATGAPRCGQNQHKTKLTFVQIADTSANCLDIHVETAVPRLTCSHSNVPVLSSILKNTRMRCNDSKPDASRNRPTHPEVSLLIYPPKTLDVGVFRGSIGEGVTNFGDGKSRETQYCLLVSYILTSGRNNRVAHAPNIQIIHNLALLDLQ